MKDISYIYFLSNHYNNVLYVGVTNNLVRRIAEHKAKINRGFTYKYNCDKLVYYESFSLMTDAIAREKQVKNWKREWKNKLIDGFNIEWQDLSEAIGVDDEYIEAVKAEYSVRQPELSTRHCVPTRHYVPTRHCGLDPQSTTNIVFNREIAGQARNDDPREGIASRLQ